MIPIDFQVTCSKVKVKLLFSAHCVVRSISFDPFIWSIPNLVQGLMSWWSLLIFRSRVQRSRSNHSFDPSVLSTLYILIPCLLASDRFCFYREDKPKFCTREGIYVSELFLVFSKVLIYTFALFCQYMYRIHVWSICCGLTEWCTHYSCRKIQFNGDFAINVVLICSVRVLTENCDHQLSLSLNESQLFVT